ncbi:MAG: hypothetical protein LBT36_03775 [Oscillospiraceae bacterium]|jgi:hypothetical protein|nr:hypothetical protein [Oscillospiraceae bacterium]
MDLLREQVEHQQYGVGDIIEQTRTVITVQFSAQHGAKKFLYPSSLESFLTLLNPALRQAVSDEFQRVRQLRETEVQSQKDESARQREELRLALLAEKRAAAKKRAPAKPKKPKKSEDPPTEALSEPPLDAPPETL